MTALANEKLPPGDGIFVQRCVLLLMSALISAFDLLPFAAGGSPDEEGFDLFHFLVGKAQLAGAHDSLSLTRVAGADNGSCDGGIVQSPCDCDFTGGAVVAAGNFLQALNQREVAREIGLGKIGMILAPIVLGQFSRALTGHGAGQQTGSHWRINDDSNAFAEAVGQNVIFDLAVHQ